MSLAIHRVTHKPTQTDVSDPFTGFDDDGNGFEILDWIRDGGADAWGRNDRLYIKVANRPGETWLDVGDRVGRRLRPDGTPTRDFYRLEPEVYDDAYGGQP